MHFQFLGYFFCLHFSTNPSTDFLKYCIFWSCNFHLVHFYSLISLLGLKKSFYSLFWTLFFFTIMSLIIILVYSSNIWIILRLFSTTDPFHDFSLNCYISSNCGFYLGKYFIFYFGLYHTYDLWVLNSLARDWTWALNSESVESYLLDRQEISYILDIIKSSFIDILNSSKQ